MQISLCYQNIDILLFLDQNKLLNGIACGLAMQQSFLDFFSLYIVSHEHSSNNDSIASS